MKLINRPGMKFIAAMLGAMSISYIIIGIIAYLNLFPAEKATDPLSIVTYFIMGATHGAITIFLCTYKEKTPFPEEE